MKKKIMDRYIDEPGTVTVTRADGSILIESKADRAKREKAAAKPTKRPATKAR